MGASSGSAGSDRLAPGVTLVFTGDYIDRGTSALAVIERLKHLQERNPGRVITLLGNHELLALQHLDEARALAAADPVGGLVAYEGNDSRVERWLRIRRRVRWPGRGACASRLRRADVA